MVGLIIGVVAGGGISTGIAWLSPKEQIYSDSFTLNPVLTARDGTKKFVLEGKIRVTSYYVFQPAGAEQPQDLRGVNILVIEEKRDEAIFREYTEIFPSAIYWVVAIPYDLFRTRYEFRVPNGGLLRILPYRDDVTAE